MKPYEFTEEMILANMYLLTVVVFNIITAMYLFNIREANYSTAAMVNLREIIPLYLFGLILIISAVLLLLAITFLEHCKSWLLLFGGLMGSFVYVFYFMAIASYNIEHALMSRFIVLVISSLIIAVTGGLTIWKEKKTKKQIAILKNEKEESLIQNE